MTDIHQVAADAFAKPTRAACVESGIGQLMLAEAARMRKPYYGGCAPEKAHSPSDTFERRSEAVLKLLASGPLYGRQIAAGTGLGSSVIRNLMGNMRRAHMVYLTYPGGKHKPALWWAGEVME